MQGELLDNIQETKNMGGELGGWGHGERKLFAVCLLVTLNFKP